MELQKNGHLSYLFVFFFIVLGLISYIYFLLNEDIYSFEKKMCWFTKLGDWIPLVSLVAIAKNKFGQLIYSRESDCCNQEILPNQ